MTNLGKCYLYRLYAFLAYAVPMLILFFVNREAYIKDPNARIGIFGFVIFALIIIAFKSTVLSAIKKCPLLTVSAFLLIFSMLMKSIAEQMILICTVSIIGSCLMLIVDVVADVYYNLSYITKDGIKTKNPAKAITDREAWREAYGFGFINRDDGTTTNRGENNE